MSSAKIELQIRPRGKPIKSLPETISIDPTASTQELYQELARRTRYSVHQLRVTRGSDGSLINNKKDIPIHSTGVKSQSTIYVKDLGPQIGWRTVFLVEYVGPIIIHPLVYALRPYVYSGAPAQASYLQTLSLLLIVGHFVKRELETLFIHRFSAATMPFTNLFRNSAHYWILAGLNMAVWMYAPQSPTAREANMSLVYGGLALYALGEFLNLRVHLTLMNLRSPGGTERAIPEGLLFDMVTCPNYTTETASWLGIWMVSNFNLAVLLFLIVAVGTMMVWARQKETRYRKEFGSKYARKRFSMLPGIW